MSKGNYALYIAFALVDLILKASIAIVGFFYSKKKLQNKKVIIDDWLFIVLNCAFSAVSISLFIFTNIYKRINVNNSLEEIAKRVSNISVINDNNASNKENKEKTFVADSPEVGKCVIIRLTGEVTKNNRILGNKKSCCLPSCCQLIGFSMLQIVSIVCSATAYYCLHNEKINLWSFIFISGIGLVVGTFPIAIFGVCSRIHNQQNIEIIASKLDEINKAAKVIELVNSK